MWVKDRKPPMNQIVIAITDVGMNVICRHTPEHCIAFTGEHENLIMDINLVASWMPLPNNR